MTKLHKPIFQDGLVLVGDEAWTPEEWEAHGREAQWRREHRRRKDDAARHRAWREKNREHVRAYYREWARKNRLHNMTDERLRERVAYHLRLLEKYAVELDRRRAETEQAA